jgi:hypothetical protein
MDDAKNRAAINQLRKLTDTFARADTTIIAAQLIVVFAGDRSTAAIHEAQQTAMLGGSLPFADQIGLYDKFLEMPGIRVSAAVIDNRDGAAATLLEYTSRAISRLHGKYTGNDLYIRAHSVSLNS